MLNKDVSRGGIVEHKYYSGKKVTTNVLFFIIIILLLLHLSVYIISCQKTIKLPILGILVEWLCRAETGIGNWLHTGTESCMTK